MKYTNFLWLLLLFFTQAYPVSSMQEIYSDYTLVVQFDKNTESYVALLPADELYAKDIVQFSDQIPWYQAILWQEISLLCGDLQLKDIGCLTVNYKQINTDQGLSLYTISFFLSDIQKTYLLKCDQELILKNMLLIPSYLLFECSLEKYIIHHKDFSLQQESFFSDIFGDEYVVDQPVILRESSSRLWHLTQKYGSKLVAYYCKFSIRVSRWWQGLKQHIKLKCNECGRKTSI